MATASLGDASLFMDMDLFTLKGEDDGSLQRTSMDFPASSLELVQLLACEDDDMFMDSSAASDDVFGSHDHFLATDDVSDAVTDDTSSEMASPPPTFGDDDARQSAPSSPAVYGFAASTLSMPSGGGSVGTMPPRPLMVKLQLPKPESPLAAPVPPLASSSTNRTASAVPSAAMLPFAFPVACFPPLNGNLKRPLPDVLPNQPAATLDPVEHKKSKRALRQMKNRESANRSRLRRKAQLTDLSGEVDELTKKQYELQNTVAALRAENKSLHDQNAFLRSLVTMYSDPARVATLPPVPSIVASAPASASTSPLVHRETLGVRPTVSLSDLESGHHHSSTQSLLDDSCESEDDDEDDDEEQLVVPTVKKPRKSLGRSAAVSAASLGFCASVFGLTIFSDSDNGAAQSSHIRRPGRVLHSLPSTSTSDQRCSPSPVAAMVERVWETCSSSWAVLTTSDLAYGVFLNVLSFVIIMGLYHCFQQYVSSSPRTSKRATRSQALHQPSSHRRGVSVSAAAAMQAKRRSVSWQDVRVEAQLTTDSQTVASTPQVQVFT